MPRESVVAHKFLEIVGQPDYVKLDDSLKEMYSSWVHISVNYSLFVESSNRRSQLSENTESVEKRHWCFAKLFPHAYVFRPLTFEYY